MTDEPPREELLDETARYLSGYVGRISNINNLVNNLDPEVRINNLNELLEYYFLRTGVVGTESDTARDDFRLTGDDTGGITTISNEPVGVLDFLRLLPERIRSLEPTITHDRAVFEGGVLGKVDWNQTQKHRHRTGDIEGRNFVCQVPSRNAVTIQNKILIELLVTIQSIYERFDRRFAGGEDSERPGWFPEWAPGETSRETVESALENVFLEDLGDFDNVSDRDVKTVMGDRNSLYDEAATLLNRYRQLAAGRITKRQAKDLLGSVQIS